MSGTHWQAGSTAARERPSWIEAERWYDSGMTRAKIAINLPKQQLLRVRREVRAGRADSVSGYIAQVLAEHERGESLQGLLEDLIGHHGKPTAEDVHWAKKALAPRRG